MVLVTRAGPAASAFFDFVRRSSAAKETLARFGYAPPDGK
jgi:hypothetical protein